MSRHAKAGMSFGSVFILSNRSEIFYSKMRILCLHNRFILLYLPKESFGPYIMVRVLLKSFMRESKSRSGLERTFCVTLIKI